MNKHNEQIHTLPGAFQTSHMTTLFYQQPGLEYTVYPPVYPAPVETEYRMISGYLDSIGYDISKKNIPSYLGHTFPALFKFWCIIHDVILECYKNRQNRFPDHDSLSLAK